MRKMTMWLVGILSLGLAACDRPPSAGAVTAAAPPPEPCKLSVGWDPWEPYQYEDVNGAMRGMDVEVVRVVAQDAGCDVRFVRGSWQMLLSKLHDGEIDLLMGASATPERETYARFSPPYRQETFALYVRSEDLERLSPKSLSQLVASGRRIGVTNGYFYGDAATQLILGDDTADGFAAAPLVELNYARLVDGEIDALLDDTYVAAALMRRKGWDAQISRHPLEISSSTVSLMYSKSSMPQRGVVKPVGNWPS